MGRKKTATKSRVAASSPRPTRDAPQVRIVEELVNEAALRLIPKAHRARVEVTRRLLERDEHQRQHAFGRGLWNFDADREISRQLIQSQKRQFKLVVGKKRKAPKIVDLD